MLSLSCIMSCCMTEIPVGENSKCSVESHLQKHIDLACSRKRGHVNFWGVTSNTITAENMCSSAHAYNICWCKLERRTNGQCEGNNCVKRQRYSDESSIIFIIFEWINIHSFASSIYSFLSDVFFIQKQGSIQFCVSDWVMLQYWAGERTGAWFDR